MASRKAKKAMGVLLMAVGGPNSLDEVGPFLLDVRGGRPTPQELVSEFRGRYAKIGGKSPLLEISTAQATALEARLNADGGSFRCHVGMRNWKPYIRDVYARMVQDGLDRIVVLPLTPYHSRLSVGAYFRAVEGAGSKVGTAVGLTYVDSWNTEPALLEAFENKVVAALAKFMDCGFPDPAVVFTAHSLPTKLMQEGDDYERELQETLALILKGLRPLRVRMAYQSVGRTEEPWLGPSLEDTLEELAEAGEEAVLVVPFGFISDHLEILYDLDIEAKGQAAALGMLLERTESLNTDPRFIDAMASVVRAAVRPVSKRRSDSSDRRT